MSASPLTERQQQVCDLVLQGFTNKQVGRKLGISHRTVEDHREAIFKAYDVHNAVGLIFKIGELNAARHTEAV